VTAPPTAAPTAAPTGARLFTRRVATVFGAKVVTFAVSLTTTIVVSRLLGREGKGAYVAVTSMPAMLGAVGFFGLPAAVNYYSARGASVRRLLRDCSLFVAVISTLSISLLWLALPWLEKSILSDAPDDMLRLMLISVPASMLAAFVGTILYGRHEVKLYTSIMVGQAILTLAVLSLLVGGLRLGVPGAVWGSVIISFVAALAVLAAVVRVSRRREGGAPASIRSLLGYGLHAYPASITGYFSYRADVFIIQALMVGSTGALGLYSMAVTMAELIFYIPDSVTTIFMPTIAGSTPEAADERLARVSRLTVLITVASSLALIPVAWAGLNVVLPQFVDCFPAFLVLLPAVVSLSLGKILTSYIAGRGRPGPISVGAVVTLILNLVANVILIPRLGIVGAAAASLISYTAMTALMLGVAWRMSGHSPLHLIVPGMAEFRVIWIGALQILARLLRLGRVAPAARGGGGHGPGDGVA
jgi:O-antigen/teichoic acid export membrane protein